MRRLMRNLLFQLPPEIAHQIAQYLLRLRYADFFYSADLPTVKKPIIVFGLEFPNPVGLAAGWDKNAECFDALFRLGFGFVEVGTVTPKPQKGNPKPRLFRIPKKQALINRMGFNNDGVDAVVQKLQLRKTPGILGVNIGKNKETPLHHALDDYQLCLKAVYPYADYIVVNISSPNTLDLRALQSDHYLPDLLAGLNNARKNAAGVYHRDVPLLLKTTVDFPASQYPVFVQTLLDNEIEGIVISNTTTDHSAVAGFRHADEAGGLSGAPIFSRTTQMIADIHQISQGKLPIIGVGGIFSASDAIAHRDAGAQLFQLYTGFVYRGPSLIQEILDKMSYNE